MKVKQEYETLIEGIKSSYSDIIADLRHHVLWLEEQLEKAQADPIKKEVEEYNRLETIKVGEVKPLEDKPKKRVYKKRHYKSAVICCNGCHKYFQAKTKRAKFCPVCKRERLNAYRREWQRKNRAAKEM